MRRRSLAASGFTLIELLVVIAVIIVLLALLLPALGGAKRFAYRTVCCGNLRQLAVAQNIYASDSGGRFPYQFASGSMSVPWPDYPSQPQRCAVSPLTLTSCAPNWLSLTFDYVNRQKNLIRCPSHKFAPNPSSLNWHSYYMNGAVSTFGGRKFSAPSGVTTLFDMPLAQTTAETRPFSLKAVPTETQNEWTGWMRFSSPTDLFSDKPHSPGRNQGYMDGHVRWIAWRDNFSGEYGLRYNGASVQEDTSGSYGVTGRSTAIDYNK